MKHFIIEITYTVALDRLQETLPAHRAFLRDGYERGLLLCSGPQSPRLGGIVVARAETRALIDAFFANDPYALESCATHRIIEFEPVLHQPWLAEWVAGTTNAA